MGTCDNARFQKDDTGSGPPTPGKSQVDIGFLRDTGTERLEKQSADLWANSEGPV